MVSLLEDKEQIASKLQWSQFLLQQGPFYEAKVPISDEHNTI